MKQIEIMVYFSIWSYELGKAEQITKILNITPTETNDKGDNKKYNKNIYDYTDWRLSTGYRRTDDGELLLNEILDKLKGKEDIIQSIINTYKAETQIMYVIYGAKYGNPSLHLSKENIEFISKIKASVDYDIYTFELDENKIDK